jgi:hypothetical protein
MAKMADKIYRDCELPRLSAEKSQKFLHAIAASGAKITSQFAMTNGFSENQMTYHSLFFRLEFDSDQALATFEKFYPTSTPEPIGIDPLWGREE